MGLTCHNWLHNLHQSPIFVRFFEGPSSHEIAFRNQVCAFKLPEVDWVGWGWRWPPPPCRERGGHWSFGCRSSLFSSLYLPSNGTLFFPEP